MWSCRAAFLDGPSPSSDIPRFFRLADIYLNEFAGKDKPKTFTKSHRQVKGFRILGPCFDYEIGRSGDSLGRMSDIHQTVHSLIRRRRSSSLRTTTLGRAIGEGLNGVAGAGVSGSEFELAGRHSLFASATLGSALALRSC
jgi:hypothetical protein